MRTLKLVLTIAALSTAGSPAWGYAAAPEADIALPSAYLSYPTSGSIGIPPETRVFVVEVTAVELVGPNGEELPALLDPSVPSVAGSVFVPIDELTAGLWRVDGVPSPGTENFSGEGVAIELGTFTVSASADTEAPRAELLGATWGLSSNAIRGDTTLSGQGAGEPIRYEIDLGDRDTLMEGVVDGTTGWTQGVSFSLALGDTVPQIEPESAAIRIRVLDTWGNVSDWSGPTSFDLVSDVEPPSGCRAAPGQTGAASGLSVLAAALAVLRRKRR